MGLKVVMRAFCVGCSGSLLVSLRCLPFFWACLFLGFGCFGFWNFVNGPALTYESVEGSNKTPKLHQVPLYVEKGTQLSGLPDKCGFQNDVLCQMSVLFMIPFPESLCQCSFLQSPVDFLVDYELNQTPVFCPTSQR